MTDVMQERGKRSRPTGALPTPSMHSPGPASLQPAGSPQPTRPRNRLAGLTIGRLVSIGGVLLFTLSVITALSFALLISWLRGAVDETAEWAEAETNLDYVHEMVTQHYVEATQSLRSTFGLPFVLETKGEEIGAEIDALLEGLEAISANPSFVELGTDLHTANADLTAVAVAGMEAVNAGEGGAEALAVLEIELAFARWRRVHNEFAATMVESQAATLDQHSARAGTAMSAMVVLTAFGLAVLGGTWSLGRQARSRERSLQRELTEDKELLDTLINQLPDSIAWKDSELRLVGCNEAMLDRFRLAGMNAPFGQRVSEVAVEPDFAARVAVVEEMEAQVIASGEPYLSRQLTVPNSSGPDHTIVRSVVPLVHKEKVVGTLSTARDITKVVELERSLASATRLESIGQLSAGIAHEINTPVQFVSDNTSFLDDSFADLLGAVKSLSDIAAEVDGDAVASISKEADLDFLLEEIPDAVTQSREGLEQIAKIVRAMKDFAHPGGDGGPTDVNRLIRSVVDVSRNEWKYDADMHVELADDLPEPHCDGGQIKQVVLNMIVNAAHAIGDSDRDRGTITVATSSDADSVFITIADDGTGIPEDVKPRIFERFFTTKEVGRGSGQGLAIAYDAIQSHGGTIEVASAVGKGTTFTIELPIGPAESNEHAD